MVGSSLKKFMTESITKSKIKRHSTKLNSGGQLTTVQEAQEKYKNNKEKLASIMANAPRHTCDITGDELILADPMYSLDVSQEEIHIEERKRHLEGEGDIKNVKKPKTGKTETQEDEDQAKTTEKLKGKLKPLQSAQLIKISKALPKLQDKEHELTTTIAEAAAPESSGWVPQALITRGQETLAELAGKIALLEDFNNKKTAYAGDVKEVFDAVKVITNKMDEIQKQMAGLLDMAKL
jgi:hypothetical protein